MCQLNDRQPPSSACTLFLALSLFLFHFRYPIPMCSSGRTGEAVYIHMAPQPRCTRCTYCAASSPMVSQLPSLQSVPIAHSHNTSSQMRMGEQQEGMPKLVSVLCCQWADIAHADPDLKVLKQLTAKGASRNGKLGQTQTLSLTLR